jgi:hypothetical protein
MLRLRITSVAETWKEGLSQSLPTRRSMFHKLDDQRVPHVDRRTNVV